MLAGRWKWCCKTLFVLQLVLGLVSVAAAAFALFLLSEAGDGDYLAALISDEGCAKKALAMRDEPDAVALTAWSKCPPQLGSAPARPLRLLIARLAALGSSTLPG